MKNKKLFITLVSLVALLGVVIGIGIHHCIKNRISFNVEDTLPDGEGKKVRVILLGGQSNASGCSLDEYLKKNVTEEKYREYAEGFDNVYINYLSGANRSGAFVKCATLQGELEGAFGPELGLAEKLNELYPDETFVIIKCAWGGTNLFEQWLSPRSKGRTGNLYKQFVAFVNSSISYLVSKNYDVKIEGMCWMQGESDSFLEDSAKNYGEHLGNFIKDIRREFGRYASDDGIAFVDACIADNPVFWVLCDDVNEGKRAVSELSEINVLIDTNAAGLSCSAEPEGQPDIPHYDSMSQIKLGHLFAIEIASFLDK